MGGLSKKAFKLTELRKDRALPSLILDGGGLFFDSIRPYRYKFDQVKIKAEGIVKAYNFIGYDAVGVSGQDLAGGLDVLQELAGKSSFSWLSANLFDKKTGSPIFTPYISKDLGGVKVAITGLTSPEIADARLLDEAADIRIWQEVMPSLIDILEIDHDFIILLTDFSPFLCTALIRSYPEINLIIRAGGHPENHHPQTLSASALVVSTGRQGKYVGALDINWIRGGSWGKSDEEYSLLMEKRNDLGRTLAQLNKIRNMAEHGALVGNLERKLFILEDDVAELKKKLEDKKLSFFRNTFYEMSDDLADQPQVMQMVLEVRKNVDAASRKRPGGSKGKAGIPYGYIGWQACTTCHQKAVSVWKGTRHANSFRTLEKISRQNDLDCLPCHFTGIDFENVADARFLPNDLKVVGCEVCHGPAREHVESQGIGKTMKVSGRICIRCHVPEHDDSHDFERDLNGVICRGKIKKKS